ncbi:MAG TPA: PIN domain-containing protein [Tepidisphaeraceae bacterium]
MWFADTFFFLALLKKDDEAHELATEIIDALHNGLVTTEWVLTEVADALASPIWRSHFVPLLDLLRNHPLITVVSSGGTLFDEGVRLYQSRPDKHWSLTDCISFVVMKDRGMTHALTGDHHFEQAGFVAILRR